MQLKDLLDTTNDPIIILDNENLGHFKSINSNYLPHYLNYQVEWLEGLPNKQVAIYIRSKKNARK